MKYRKIELFISLVTAASVAAILIQYVYPLNTLQMRAVYIFDFIVVVILAIDFTIRMNASEDGRLKFVLKHWYEIPAMIPLVAFTLLENDLMTGAAARGLRLLRLFRLVQLFFRTLRIFEGSKYLYFVAFSTMAIIIGAFGIYIAESHEETSTVRNLGDASWLAIGTITTATYGDVYPVSIDGRAITVVLMFVGLAILGVFVSTIGATIESRLRKSQVHKRLLADDRKGLIKSKIDEIEDLSPQDFNYLMISIGNLRDMLLRGEREYFKQ